MKIGEVWISKLRDPEHFCRIRIFDKVDSETWIVEVLECSRKWHSWFYLAAEATDEGDYRDVLTMKFKLTREEIVEYFVRDS